MAVWCVATGAGDSRKAMWDRSDKSYWTYGFCVHNLSTLTLNTNVSSCIYTRIYKLFFRFGYCTSGDFRCCVVAASRPNESADLNRCELSMFKTSIIFGENRRRFFSTYLLFVLWGGYIDFAFVVPFQSPCLYMSSVWCGIPCSSMM